DRNRSHWSTSKTPSYTKSVSWQHHRQQLLLYHYLLYLAPIDHLLLILPVGLGHHKYSPLYHLGHKDIDDRTDSPIYLDRFFHQFRPLNAVA
ncbi:hypothetical protein MZE72_23530, partial [Escherichia coli]|nr:hypothetical protein [Escherichia coli]